MKTAWKNPVAWLCCCGLLALAGCSRAEAAGPEPYQGLIEFEERALSFQVSGKIKRLRVERGDFVNEGAVIAELDDTLERPMEEQRMAEAAGAIARLELVRAGAKIQEVRSLEGELHSAMARERAAMKQLERSKELVKASAIPESTLDEAEGSYNVAVGQRMMTEQSLAALRSGARPQEVAMAKADVAATHAALASVQARLETYELRSPVTGQIVDVDARNGETVGAATPIVVLADVGHPRVDVFVPQGKVSGISTGDSVSVRVDGVERSYSGVVEDIGRRTEFTPRFLFSERERPNLVMRVRVRITDADEQLHAGVPAFATFSEPSGKGPLHVEKMVREETDGERSRE